MRRISLSFGIAFALMPSLGACTPKPTATSYSQAEANTVMTVQYATVTAIRAVDIRPGKTRLGAITGGILGGVAGSQIGSSTAANIAGGVGGAVVGGAAGSAIQGSSRTKGVELTLKLDSGETVAVVQPGNPNDFRVDDRVRITGSAERARVSR